ncbi:TraR/DksA C4-type zinc finger protein [Nocardioides sp. HDW12B]|uniref:TraR/DksA family transcriptional regulator n=1 Tax=Nocardioides sp. HDW12B TaxID=2714939 RepID=UPI00197D3F0E|nr:TraR/DksA C4-type zinc finger protein [Nocardioides sp. HDW12B]
MADPTGPPQPAPTHAEADLLLAERETRLVDQLATLTAAPAEMGNISFGKRVGEGTNMAVDRLTAVSAQEELLTMLDDVRRARERVADGSYGVCEVCGTPIPAARLEARPWAARCLQHA